MHLDRGPCLSGSWVGSPRDVVIADLAHGVLRSGDGFEERLFGVGSLFREVGDSGVELGSQPRIKALKPACELSDRHNSHRTIT